MHVAQACTAPDAGCKLRAAHEARRVPVGLVAGAEFGQVPLIPVSKLPEVLLLVRLGSGGGGGGHATAAGRPWQRRTLPR
jgi:hypothetical protein